MVLGHIRGSVRAVNEVYDKKYQVYETPENNFVFVKSRR